VRVRELADTADGDSYVFGGSRTVAALAEADLVDEYQIFVPPSSSVAAPRSSRRSPTASP
jgi:dihydrofolate reductase